MSSVFWNGRFEPKDSAQESSSGLLNRKIVGNGHLNPKNLQKRHN